MAKRLNDYDTVALDDKDDSLVIIDQTKLPGKLKIEKLNKLEDIWEAIYLLKVRGAPAIGVAAAFAYYIEAKKLDDTDIKTFEKKLEKVAAYLNSARPTAVNLSWALKRMGDVVRANRQRTVREIVALLHDEAVKIRDEDVEVCRRIGEHGLELIKKGDGILTHCNAGRLATIRYGTATAPIYLGQEKGYYLRVFADETRPLLQGARLTAYELKESGIDVTLICDNMSATVMKKGWVNAVFVGCDRVAANGDAANKIGTSMLALAAKRNNIPFYVCAPSSTIDINTKTGNDIVIEERPKKEVTSMWYKERMAPKGVKVFNPAFDVTDSDLISGIITEFGVLRSPYKDSIRRIFEADDKFK